MLGWFAAKIRQYSLSKKIKEFMDAYKEAYNKKTDSRPTNAEALLKHYLKKIDERVKEHGWYLDQSGSLHYDLLDLRTLMAYEKNNIHNALFAIAVKIRNELADCAPESSGIAATHDSQSNPITSIDAENEIFTGNEADSLRLASSIPPARSIEMPAEIVANVLARQNRRTQPIVRAFNIHVDRSEPIHPPVLDEQSESCMQRFISSLFMS